MTNRPNGADPDGSRPQDAGRSRIRRRRVEARPLESDERLAILERTPAAAYREAIAAASWLFAADELAVRLLADVLDALSPPAPPGVAVTGGPMPAPIVPLADRLKLWALALDLAGELGLTADARRRIGLELTPAPAPTGPVKARRPRRGPIDFGGD